MKLHVVPVVCVFLLGIIHASQAANILFFFGLAGYSHRLSVWPLVTALADRGHNVTFLSTQHVKDAERHSKVREFYPKEVEDELSVSPLFDESEIFLNRIKKGRFQGGGAVLLELGLAVCKIFVSSKETQRLLETTKFDLIVIDGLFND